MDKAKTMLETVRQCAAMSRRIYEQSEDDTDDVPAALENLADVLQGIYDGEYDEPVQDVS